MGKSSHQMHRLLLISTIDFSLILGYRLLSLFSTIDFSFAESTIDFRPGSTIDLSVLSTSFLVEHLIDFSASCDFDFEQTSQPLSTSTLEHFLSFFRLSTSTLEHFSQLLSTFDFDTRTHFSASFDFRL